LLEGQLDIISEQIELILEQNSTIELTKQMESAPEPVEITPETRLELESISNEMDSDVEETGVIEGTLDDVDVIQQNIDTILDDIDIIVIPPPEETEPNLPPLPPPAP